MEKKYNSKIYLFDELEIGESFWVKNTVKNVRSSIFYYTKYYGTGREFTLRSEDGGCRCWRFK